MRNRKIAIISNSSSYGGASTYCINICIGLKQNNVDIYLVIPLDERFNNRWIYEKARENNIKTIEFIIDTRNPVSLGIKLYKLLRNNRISIIHSNGYRVNLITHISVIWGLFNLYKLKHIVTVHGINPSSIVPWQIALYQRVDYIFSFMNSSTITVSNCARNVFLKKALVHASKVEMIYNSIYCYSHTNQINVIDNKDEEVLNIVFIGRLTKEKGIDFLIKIINHYISSSKNLNKVKFIIYGDGDYDGAIIDLEKKYPSIVSYQGYIDNSNVALQNAFILIIPSVIETFCLVILEAMANGVPVIATRVGGIPEVIDDNNNGLLVDYGNVNDFVYAIDNLIDDTLLKEKLIKNAYFTLDNKFGFDNFINSYISLVSSLL